METKEFKIEEFQGTNILKLGLTSEQYQRILNKTPRRFKKVKNALESDSFQFCHIYYDQFGKSKAIEFWPPTKISINNFSLMEKNYLEVEKYFYNLDNDIIKEEGVGFVSVKYQIGIYAPYDIVEGVLVARKGYYEYDDK